MVNYTAREVPYTRVIEHKHFQFGAQEKTVLTWEYPAPWQPGEEPYYPVNDEKNQALLARYQELARSRPEVLFGGRLAATATTTWTRSSAPPWTPQPKSWPDLPQRVGSPSCKWLENVLS